MRGGGLLYVSVNAGAFRLLVPDAHAALIGDMCGPTVAYVVVTGGRYAGRPALELMWEDGSDAPFSIHIDARRVDRLPAANDEGRTDLRLLVYVQPGTVACAGPARYRRADLLPYLKPWRSGDAR